MTHSLGGTIVVSILPESFWSIEYSQASKQEDESQRHLLHRLELQPPKHIDRKKQDDKVESNIDDSKCKIEAPQAHALDCNGPVPPAVDRYAKENRGQGFRKPPSCDQSDQKVNDHPEFWCGEYATVHQEGGYLDAWGGRYVDLVESVDAFQEFDHICCRDFLDMPAAPVQNTCSNGQWYQ